jgi:hypothetical protein
MSETPQEMWCCVGCGETFDEPRRSHGKAGHEPGCTGECVFCPIEIECGPIVPLHAESGWGYDTETGEEGKP